MRWNDRTTEKKIEVLAYHAIRLRSRIRVSQIYLPCRYIRRRINAISRRLHQKRHPSRLKRASSPATARSYRSECQANPSHRCSGRIRCFLPGKPFYNLDKAKQRCCRKVHGAKKQRAASSKRLFTVSASRLLLWVKDGWDGAMR